MKVTELKPGRRYRLPGPNPGTWSDSIEVVTVGRKWLTFRPVLDGIIGRKERVLISGWVRADNFREVEGNE